MEICQLPDVPLFRGLTEAEAETAITALWMRRKAFAKGEILLEAGQCAPALGVVRLLPVDYSTSSSGGVIAAVAALFFTVIFVMLALSQAHDGTEGLADELD